MLFNKTRYAFLIVGVLVCLNLFSQQSCDSTSLTEADKISMQNFWIAFKDAINKKDKDKLASLCRFPFNCDYCIFDTAKSSTNSYVKVTRTSFAKSQYRIFLAGRLVSEVNRYNLPEDVFIFQQNYNAVDKKCYYSFGYIAREENAQHPGMQHFFDIQNVNGQFKIVSSWTIP